MDYACCLGHVQPTQHSQTYTHRGKLYKNHFVCMQHACCLCKCTTFTHTTTLRGKLFYKSLCKSKACALNAQGSRPSSRTIIITTHTHIHTDKHNHTEREAFLKIKLHTWSMRADCTGVPSTQPDNYTKTHKHTHRQTQPH